MLKTSRLAALAIVGVMAASPSYSETKPAETKPAETKAVAAKPSETKPLAPSTSISIPQERVDLRVKMVLAQQQGQSDSPELRKAIKDDLVNIELMSQEAIKQGLDMQSEITQQLVIAKQTVLVSAFVQDYVKTHPISDETIAKEYANLKTHLGNQEYHIRHILVETEAEAKTIAAELKKAAAKPVKVAAKTKKDSAKAKTETPEDTFDKLAKASSKDAGSKDHGGDLGWIPVGDIPNTFVKPFGEAVLKLGKGQVSEPVQSQFGWHIIKLEDLRDLKIPPLEELKQQLTQRLQQQSVKQLITDLRSKAKVD